MNRLFYFLAKRLFCIKRRVRTHLFVKIKSLKIKSKKPSYLLCDMRKYLIQYLFANRGLGCKN